VRGDKAAASFHPPPIPRPHVTYPRHVTPLSHGRFSSCPLPIVSLTLRAATSPRLMATPFPPLRRIVNPGRSLIQTRVNTSRFDVCSPRGNPTSCEYFLIPFSGLFPLLSTSLKPRSIHTRASGFWFHLSRVQTWVTGAFWIRREHFIIPHHMRTVTCEWLQMYC